MAKKALILLVAIFLVIFGCSCGEIEESSSAESSSQSEAMVEPDEVISSSEAESTESSASSEPDEAASSSNSASESEPVKEVEESSEATQKAEDDRVSTEAVASLIEVALAENYSGYDITYDETSITINLWQDGIAEGLSYIQAGLIGKDSWTNVKDSLITMANACCDLIDAAGREDVILVLNVLNDQNHERIFLTLLEGSVIYDVMAD